MTELGGILEEIGLGQYLETFVEHGFDSWSSFADITEPDFDVIGVKLGHRRKIQRKIADARGISAYQPLISPTANTPSDDRASEDSKTTATRPVLKDGSTHAPTGKRKYRRHPKADESAPERPPSAYVIFSNKMREDLKGRHLSFTEIAKLVGENWQALSPQEKEPFEAQAFTAKEKYNAGMIEYKKTDSYKVYAAYLAEFKEKHPSQQQAADVAKRPKLVNEHSGGSGSAASHQSSEAMTGHGRGGSVSSVGPTWFAGDAPSQASNQPNQNAVRAPASPTTLAANILPGYREAIFGSNQQTLVWRENARDAEIPSVQHLPRIHDMGDRRSGRPGPATFDAQGHIVPTSQATILRSTSSFASPPPLLTSESTSGTTSSTSSLFYPRTPLEVPLDRSLPMPGHMYATKPPSLFETQLPPLQTSSSTSPKGTPYKSPTTIPPISEFSHRGYAISTQPPTVSLPSFADHNAYHGSGTTQNDDALDPVSALLRADEIVSRQGPRR